MAFNAGNPTMQDGDDMFNDAMGFGSFQGIEQPERPPRRPPRPPEHLDENNTNRKMLDMPPVVGSMIHYNNKHLKYRAFPPDIDQVRDKLYRLDKDMLLDSQQIADFWPHMSSVWQRSTKPTEESNGAVMEVWECRNRRRVGLKGKGLKGTGERNRPNKDEILGDIEPCKLRIRLVSYTKHVEDPKEPCGAPGILNCKCIPEWLHLSRTVVSRNANHQHTHDIEMSDRFKRPDSVMYFAKLKVEEGYSYSTVLKWIHEKYGPVSTQVKHLTKQDVANVSRWWRMLNKDLQLRKDIEDETDWDRRRRECLDDIETTSQKRMAKALSEICKRIPEAIEIALPYLEKHSDESEEMPKIAEGDDIVVPQPGIPERRDQKIPNLFVPSWGSLDPPPQPPPKQQPQQQPPAPVPPPVAIPRMFQAIPYTANGASGAGPSRSLPESNGAAQPPTLSNPNPTRHPPNNTPMGSHVPAPYAPRPSPTTITPSRNLPPPSASWPPPSVSHPVAPSSASPAPQVNGAGSWRPAWATPNNKRPAASSPEEDSQPPKRTLVEEIASQLRSELTSG